MSSGKALVGLGLAGAGLLLLSGGGSAEAHPATKPSGAGGQPLPVTPGPVPAGTMLARYWWLTPAASSPKPVGDKMPSAQATSFVDNQMVTTWKLVGQAQVEARPDGSADGKYALYKVINSDGTTFSGQTITLWEANLRYVDLVKPKPGITDVVYSLHYPDGSKETLMTLSALKANTAADNAAIANANALALGKAGLGMKGTYTLYKADQVIWQKYYDFSNQA